MKKKKERKKDRKYSTVMQRVKSSLATGVTDIRVLIQDVITPLSIQFPVNSPGKQ